MTIIRSNVVIEALKDMLMQWNTTYGERAKLQHTLVVLVIVGVVLAGLVGLLNYDASRTILRVCFAGVGVIVANAVVWALLSSMVLGRFPARRTTRK
jgi:undecaprenyl pyrophosphate phosphatase UppP